MPEKKKVKAVNLGRTISKPKFELKPQETEKKKTEKEKEINYAQQWL
ncbi:hypothetical protein OAB17_06035 [Flavobacteriaceae bacterium]|nr:hypothetical protein [Flavobacteriaceae bacterium]